MGPEQKAKAAEHQPPKKARDVTKSSPSEREMDVLKVLWQLGEARVREVHEAMCPNGECAFTTVQTLLRIMADKGLVRRDEKQRAHVYEARQPREKTQKALLDHIVDRAFGGSAAQLAMRALSTRKPKPEELAEVRRMLDEFEGGR